MSPVNRFSCVETLVFTRGIPEPPLLASILSWTRDLRHLHLEFEAWRPNTESMPAFHGTFVAIASHAPYLQRLFIGCLDDEWSLAEEVSSRSLTGLDHLRELDLPHRFLMGTHPHRFFLPPNLQCLTVRIDGNLFKTLPYWIWTGADRFLHPADYLDRPRVYFFVAFWLWLTRCLLGRGMRYPSLKKVCVYRRLISDRYDDTPDSPMVRDIWEPQVRQLQSSGITLEAFVRDQDENWERKEALRFGDARGEWYRI